MAAKKPNFETSMARLEEIVRKMEQGETSLADSITLFEEGTKLAALLHKLLDEAEQKVQVLHASAVPGPSGDAPDDDDDMDDMDDDDIDLPF